MDNPKRTQVIDPETVKPFKGESKKLQRFCAKLSNQMRGDGIRQLESADYPIPTQSQINSHAFTADKQRDFIIRARKVIREAGLSERYSIFDKQIELLANKGRGRPRKEEQKQREDAFSISPEESTNRSGRHNANRAFIKTVNEAFGTSTRTGLAGTREQKQKLVSNMSMGSSQLRSTMGMQTWTQLPDEQLTGRSTQSSEPRMNRLRASDSRLSSIVDFGVPLEELVPEAPHDLSASTMGLPGSPDLSNAIFDVLGESGVDIDEDEVRKLTESMSSYITGDDLTRDQKVALIRDIYRATPNMNLSDSVTVTADLLDLTDNFSSNPERQSEDLSQPMVEYDENPQLELTKPNIEESKYDQTERKYNLEPPVQLPIESKAIERVEEKVSFEPTKDIAEVAGAFENAFSLIFGSEYDSAAYGTENIERVKNFVEESKVVRDLGAKHDIEKFIEHGKSGLIEAGQEVLESAKRTGMEAVKDIATDFMSGGELDPWDAATSVAENVLAESARRIKERLGGEVPRDAPGVLDDMKGLMKGGRGFSEGAGGSGDLPERYNRQGPPGGNIHGEGNNINLTQRSNAAPTGKPVPVETTLAGASKGKTVIKKRRPRPISSRRWHNQIDIVQQSVAGADAYRNIFQNTYGAQK